MKRGVILLFVSIFMLASFASASLNATCEDSDKSINYNVKGVAKGNWYKNLTQIVEYADACAQEGEKTLNEYYCDEAAVAVVTYKCSVACEDGACVKGLSPPQVCEDTDANNVQSKGSTSAKTFNASWGGSLIILNATTAKSDYCAKTSAPAENIGECTGADCGVVEMTCVQSGRNQIGLMTPTTCQFGCKDGACLKEAPKPIEVPKPECTSIGNVTGTRYCSPEQRWVSLKNDSSACTQAYECAHGLCNTGLCASPQKSGFFAGLWKWMKGLFGK